MVGWNTSFDSRRYPETLVMTQSDQTNDKIECKTSLHKFYMASKQMLPKFAPIKPSADPAMKREMVLYRRRNGSLHHIGGLNFVSNLLGPPLTDTQCTSHKAQCNR